ncbi:MAG: hypothetical protein JRF65_13905, partial [Deltaproteobacteria bacterium]|nr:hypothetical protein [Deltaproteobacteria bacterium]
MANAPPDPMRRIALLQTALAKEGVDGGFFTYSRTLLYYCGTTHPAILLVTPRDYRLL